MKPSTVQADIQPPAFYSPWMDTEQAAKYIGCQPGTLKTWRATGMGPKYHVIHSKLVRYRVEELDSFLTGKRFKCR